GRGREHSQGFPMRYSIRKAALTLLLAAAAVVGGRALAVQDKPPTIAEVMRKLNSGTTSLTPTLALDLKDAEPDWAGIQESTAEYVKLTATLPTGTPSKGDKASWKRLAQAYFVNAKALDAAAKRKDRRGAAAVLGRIQNSCKACHLV